MMILQAFVQYLRHGSAPLHGQADTSPQKYVDLSRFIGRWYEMARFDRSFETGLEEVYADYAFTRSGKRLSITNTGTDPKGRVRRAHAGAKIPNPAEPGLLRVSFVPPYRWFYMDFRILYVDPYYREALISGADSRYLWFMSRSPVTQIDSFKRLLHIAQARGFRTEDLHITHHRPQPALPETRIVN